MTIWQSIRTGIQNGNIAKWTKAIGKATFGIGMTGMVIHDMKKNSGCSIFGNRCGCGGYNYFGGGYDYFGGGYNIPWQMQADPMGFTWLPSQGSTNPYLTQAGLDTAYQYGQMLRQQFPPTTITNTNNILKRDNKAADAVSSDTDKKAGAEFNTATNNLMKDGKINEDAKDVTIAKITTESTKMEDYKKQVSDLSKSYLANIDSDGDGYINKEEYIKHETENLPSDTSEKEIANQKVLAETLFKTMDLNQDGKIDWKEMSAGIVTQDAGGSKDGKLDGKISAKDYDATQNNFIKNTTEFSNTLWKNYQGLFGKDE